MKAVIMAGGEGTRLRPLTANAPKPMLPIVNRPMMEHVVGLLRHHGFDDIVVTVAYLSNAIRNYFGDGSDWGVKMVYATEETPLGTAGSVRNAAQHLDERFLVISGDVLTDVDLGGIVRFHEEHKALATIALVAVENPLEFGIVITREDGSIERFLEKPSWGQVFSDTINTGIFVLEPEIFDHIEADRPVDFSGEVFPKLLADGHPLFGAVAEGYWEDVGTLDAYVGAHKDALDGKVRVDVEGFELRPGVFMGEGAELHPEARVEGPVVIGDNCRVEAGVRLGPYTVLGTNVRIRDDADLERSVVHDNAYLGEGVRLRGAVIGRSSDLRRAARVEEGVVIGDECFVGEGALLSPGIKVYPFKTIEAGAIVNSSIVWETRGARSLFGRYGVTGLANVDITPELAARVAQAWASSLKKGSTVVTSRDSSRSARMLKRAMMAGLNAGGINVVDVELASVPITRFVVRRPYAAGGVTVRLVEGDPQSVILRFFDENGLDLSEDQQRKIERLFGREDFRQVLPSEIGDIEFPPRALEHYASAVYEQIDLATFKERRFKIVLDYSFGATALAMPNVLGKLSAEVLALNPYTSTVGVMEFDRAAAAARVGRLVEASGADLGAVLAPDGERLLLIDGRGRVLDETQAALAFVDLVGARTNGDRIAVPITATDRVRDLAERHGLTVQYTKVANAALMEAATERGVGFALNMSGGYILPGFLPAFDGAAALMKLLELLAADQRDLAEVVDALPAVHQVHETVVTPWEQKGTVMRTLMERSGDRELELVDGVKVRHPDGWALALPDPEEPITHIWAEAGTRERAKELAQEYGRRLRQMIR
jgi:mannose-1-phosphate guanylyltransferase / phosphomannomutase